MRWCTRNFSFAAGNLDLTVLHALVSRLLNQQLQSAVPTPSPHRHKPISSGHSTCQQAINNPARLYTRHEQTIGHLGQVQNRTAQEGAPSYGGKMPTELPPRYPPRIQVPILVDAIMAIGIALIVVVSANFVFWLTS